ncbi:MFS general substrate transporter [Penicillium herquei]|nr:MFS general substrate transporter [Penicillium herquei]
MEEHADSINLDSALGTETNVLRDAEGLNPTDNSSQVHPSVGNENEVEVKYLSGVKLTLLILAVIAIALLVMLDMSIVATAIPKMTSDFHTTAGVGWYGSAYLLTR